MRPSYRSPCRVTRLALDASQSIRKPPCPRCQSSAASCPLGNAVARSEEHTSELQSQSNLVCRLLLEKKKKSINKRRKRLKSSHSQISYDVLYLKKKKYMIKQI